MPLIKEKIGVGFAGVYLDDVAPVARNISRHGATKPQGSQRYFITSPAGYRK
jgi:hypothetical protein